MGNSLRCCLACVLPCGALDVVRVVHLDGQVEEYSRHVSAREVLAANPDHVLTDPCSRSVVRRILIVSPDSELKRGRFYFLVPASTLPEQKKRSRHTASPVTRSQSDDNYQTEILSEKRSVHRRRRNGRVGVWRPHLESICEDS
ncbi:hypothetical protein MUK42_05147 [Musa troglodytarum]|uniref:6,7-dimethyl-8-ribityllumazine synthase n=1 Tax=Musa troglodytarum TaxID=320322 RepID=A0A9E7EW42_9LILI|nr:hypothetical protein MUK42_05147 [Musa troglodytarum]